MYEPKDPQDTRFAQAIEEVISTQIADLVEVENESILARMMNEDGRFEVSDDFQKFFHLYRATEDTVHYCGCSPDPYLGLQGEEFVEAVLKSEPLVLVTNGWAAPVGEDDSHDFAPSEHPGRRRVRMTLVVETLGKFVSIVRFMDDPEEETFTETNGLGPLRDAIESRMLEIVAGMN